MSLSEVPRVFHYSGLHSRKLQHTKDAYAVAVFRTTTDAKATVHLKRNHRGAHAEKNMIQHLEDVLEREVLVSQTITVYVNFSPCWVCSGQIRDFLERAEEYYDVEIELEIVFAHLYKVRRPSCVNGAHPKEHSLPELAEHRLNVQGLRSLNNWAGVTLRPFSKADWKKLRKISGCRFIPWLYSRSGREAEDANLLKDFQRLCL